MILLNNSFISVDLPEITTSISIALRFSFTTLPGSSYPNRACLLYRGASDVFIINYAIFLSSNSIDLTWTTAHSGWVGNQCSYTADTNIHTLVLCQNWDSDVAAIYLDGSNQTLSVDNSSQALTSSETSQLLGKRPDGTPEYFNGLLGHVGIWNTILTADEAALYHANPYPPNIQPGSLLRHFPYWDSGMMLGT